MTRLPSSSTSPPAVFARLQRNESDAYGQDREEMLGRFAGILSDLASHVPVEIEILFHFCYGEPNMRSSPSTWANRLCAAIKRPIALIHMPVPRERSDDAYFAPLAELMLHPETEFCIGLVHYSDGIAGTRQRLATAERHVQRFSIATECGFGRRDPGTIPELLRIHAEVAA